MSRAFNGTTDSITFGAGSAPPDQGPITVVALVKAANTAGFTGWFVRGRSGTSSIWSTLTSNNAGAKLFMENDFGSGVAGLNTSWTYYVGTKAAGSNLPRWHVQVIGGSWTHTNGSANVPDGTGPIDNVFVGQSFPGEFAVIAAIAAEWNDATVEANCTLSAADLYNAVNASGWMVRFNQASTATAVSNDCAGGGNQSAISGTTVGSTDPAGYDYSISSGQTVAPGGIAVGTALGSPGVVNSMDAVTPTGIAVARALGQPSLAWSGTGAPNGIAVLAAFGQPAAGNGMNAVTPNGIAIARALGTPTAAQSFAPVPGGVAVPVALGQPVLQQLAGAVFPTGLAIGITVGQPTVAGQPYVPPAQTGGSWWGLLSAERQLPEPPLVACPYDGEPLRRSVDGITYCPFDGRTFPDGRAESRAGVSGRDWGGALGIQKAAEADTGANALVLSCPNDGEPLTYENGSLRCRYDGWSPDGH